MDDDRLQLLLQRFFDQMLTVEERSELATMLLASGRARSEFWELARWNALIRQWGEAEWGRRDAETLALRPLPAPAAPQETTRGKVIAFPRPTAHFWRVALAVAAVLALFAAAPSFVPWKKTPDPERAMPARVAVLTHSADVVWADSGSARQNGEGLTPGWLKLKSGAVQVEFSRGTRVVLEGPAELQLLTDNAAYLRTGKLRAQVPEAAHGFTVRSPEFTVVDHGTEFGCVVPVAGAPQVHVFNGLVALQRAKTRERKLRKDQAVQVERSGLIDIPVRREHFLSDEELARRERAGAYGQLAVWREASRALSEHPSALLHLDFEGDRGWDRSIPNRAWRAVPEAPASMVGCEFADGRWPGKGGVEFKREDDRLRLKLPGGYQSMSFVAWIRVDSLADHPQSLVMANGLGTGDVQWYLTRWGELGFAVHIGKAGDPNGWRHFHSQPLISPEMLGAWVCLASIYDGTSDTLTHYFDGEPVGSERLGVRTLLQLETFEIGNWALHGGNQLRASVHPRTAADTARNFNGRIDELAILSAALSPEEMRNVHEGGQGRGAAVQQVLSKPYAP